MRARGVRLLHVIASADPASGGPIEGIVRQNEVSAGWGTRDLVTADLPDAPYLSNLDMPVFAMGAPAPNVPGRGLLKHYAYTPNLVPWLRQNVGNYDAVVVNGLWNYATMAASVVLRDAKVPYFVFPHGMMDPWFKRSYPLKHLAKQAFWLFNEGPLLKGARAVLFTTEEERVLARQSFWPNRYNEVVVGYGTSAPPPRHAEQDAAFRATIPALGSRRYLLFLSRIHPKKGCDLLIQAFAEMASRDPELDLVVAGPDRGWRPALQLESARLGVADRVHWPGMLQGNAKWGAFYGADAFVLPSHQENFGIVVAEALACGTPVLITNKVNIWREVKSAGAGIVAEDDAAGIRTLLSLWFSESNAQRRQMSRASVELFREKFDVAQSAQLLMNVITQNL